jgi:hypothetical protein
MEVTPIWADLLITGGVLALLRFWIWPEFKCMHKEALDTLKATRLEDKAEHKAAWEQVSADVRSCSTKIDYLDRGLVAAGHINGKRGQTA